eukprot:scaffold57029_cov52-Phaeocystis_antarctica.AAC.1
MSSLLASDRAFADCRVERRACDAGRGLGRKAGGRGATAARAACTARGPGCEGWGGYRACAERTKNILYMLVTLEMSRLSGWLNTDAPCRVERRGVRCGVRCRPGSGRTWAGGNA